VDSDQDSEQRRLDRLDIVDAAARLGLSIDAVRKRVQRGTLPAEKVDGRWLVVLPVHDSPGQAEDGDLDTSQEVQDGGQDVTRQAIAALAEAFTKTLDAERARASAAEQAAAMWQERARNLEAQVEQLLALPAHEEEPVPNRRWWKWWRRAD
jgi:hypothetical protein